MANQPQQPDTALHNASHLMQYHDLIESIVAALDARDAYTASHSDRVADMVLVLAAALGLDEDETTRIHMAAHLHDIGKIAVPDSVLRKAGPLTRPEWEEMRRHPVTGYEILRKIDDFKEIAILVRHHHERWDGRGYPDGLSGHDIPPGSRVIAVADSIDAMMSSRSYRPAMTSAACRREIEKNSGIMYDPRVAAAALEHWDELVSRYAGADTPRTPYFDRLQLEHTRQAHDYLLTHQGSRITLPELAAKFHLSQSSLKICFKALYGVPPARTRRKSRSSGSTSSPRPGKTSSTCPLARPACGQVWTSSRRRLVPRSCRPNPTCWAPIPVAAASGPPARTRIGYPPLMARVRISTSGATTA